MQTVHHGLLVQLDLLARTQRHPKAVPVSREQQNPDLNDLRVLKSQAKSRWTLDAQAWLTWVPGPAGSPLGLGSPLPPCAVRG